MTAETAVVLLIVAFATGVLCFLLRLDERDRQVAE
jgi:hypothetical protein